MATIKSNEINWNSDAYNTGYEAAKLGEPRSANPHCRGTIDAANWLAGWKDAEFVMSRVWKRSIAAQHNG